MPPRQITTAQNFPALGAPLVDPQTGMPTDVFQNFLQWVYTQLGGPTGGYDLAGSTARSNQALTKGNALSELSGPAYQSRARASLGLSAGATAKPTDGWTAPTGTVSRASINAGWTGTASSAYTQAELQAVVTQLEAISGAAGALIDDCASYGVLGFGG